MIDKTPIFYKKISWFHGKITKMFKKRKYSYFIHIYLYIESDNYDKSLLNNNIMSILFLEEPTQRKMIFNLKLNNRH